MEVFYLYLFWQGGIGLKKNRLILIFLVMILSSLYLFWGLNQRNFEYLFYKRIPILLAILIISISIGFSTLIFQTITSNRILTPSILGLDSLYVLIQSSILVFLGSNSIWIQNTKLNFLVCIFFMIIFSSIVFYFLFHKKENNLFLILLMGLIFSSLFQSLHGFFQRLLDPNAYLLVQDKSFASFNNLNVELTYLCIFVLFVILLYSLKYLKILDVLSLGKEISINLGINYIKKLKIIFLLVVVMTSIATALVGTITFLGLLVVNISYSFSKTFKHKILLQTCSLIAMIVLLTSQILAQIILNMQIPITAIINFIGGIYFIFLMLQEAQNVRS